ncbi:hypothetical protein ACIQWA_07025 [Kitasatospora sp. NPDC098652]|uniref:hypothetical protein n=1 Tax=Kitasatospora sp. NPDC098652 TaxID=3364095 RepID=UPI003809857F
MPDIKPVRAAVFCDNCGCSCGCPKLFLGPAAPAERRIRITDDFGQQIHLRAEQFADLLGQAMTGPLDHITAQSA